MGTFEEYISELMDAIKEAQRRGPLPLSGQTYPVNKEGRTVPMDRVYVEATLQTACPRGLSYMYHHLGMLSVSTRDFEAACDHFGLRSVLRNITREEVAGEARARRERGDKPSTGYLPADLNWHFSREEADARMAIVRRRIAEAKARAAGATPAA